MSAGSKISTTKPPKVRTIMDELLYESAKSSVNQANLANQKRNVLPPSAIPTTAQLSLLREEIEHSAVAIVSTVTCLDTYLNSVFEDKITSNDLLDSLKSMGPVQKWYNAPSLLGSSTGFNFDSSPMSDFRTIVKYRHKLIIHRQDIYIKQNSIHIVPEYEHINAANASLALKTSQSMISSLCRFIGTSVPGWVI